MPSSIIQSISHRLPRRPDLAVQGIERVCVWTLVLLNQFEVSWKEEILMTIEITQSAPFSNLHRLSATGRESAEDLGVDKSTSRQ